MKTNTTPVVVNKAEEKRVKQAIETLTRQLTNKMIDFKERFLTSYVNYRFSEFDIAIKNAQSSVYSAEKNGKYGYTLEMFNKDKSHRIAILEREKALKSTNTLKFITEASDNYNVKFSRLVDELVKHGVRSYPLTIEQIGGGTSFDFSFLITHKTTVQTIEVYARIIFACGEINAPHYRFIITANKNEIHTK